MTYLLDTNVISEWVKPQPALQVVSWLTEVDEDRVYLSVISFAEIRYGIEAMPACRRRDRLMSWLTDDMPARFEGRILALDVRIAYAWGAIMARCKQAGVTCGSMDAFIAATAEVHDLTLVTRNSRDFVPMQIPLFDPWSSETH